MNRHVLSAVPAVGAAGRAARLPVPAARADAGTTVTVMTRNLYFGTDPTPVIEASAADFTTAVANAYDEAQASDFARRADAWADEISLVRPDLVGLNGSAAPSSSGSSTADGHQTTPAWPPPSTCTERTCPTQN